MVMTVFDQKTPPSASYLPPAKFRCLRDHSHTISIITILSTLDVDGVAVSTSQVGRVLGDPD